MLNDRRVLADRSLSTGQAAAVTVSVVPAYTELLWPTVCAVRGLGGSGSIDEINERVLKQENFSDDQQSVLHGDGPQIEIEYRLAWERTYLKGMGLLENSKRGVWTLTDAGRTVTDAEIAPLHKEYVVRSRAERKQRPRRASGAPEATDGIDASEEVADWRDSLLDRLMAVQPDAFERLAQRLLREAGFISATVTGRTGDGGIDGLGVYRMSLVSFPVFFQCKRYKGSVGSSAVRDFRGAMAGRGDKGLLITTGTFTADAKARPPATGRHQLTSLTDIDCATC